jgi:CRISPR-associated endoribonuclease Cas6
LICRIFLLYFGHGNKGGEVRVRIELESANRSIVLPESYNYFLQSYIYSSLSTIFAGRLHDEGWGYGKRRFKMFTFSQLYSSLIERFQSAESSSQKKQFLRLDSPIWFYLSSPEHQILQELAQGLLTQRETRLWNNILSLEPVAILPSLELLSDGINTITVSTISPITVYKTDDTHHTTYFSPHDAAFAVYIRENARRKYAAFFGHEPDLTGFDIAPVDEYDHPITIDFKGTIIRGYAGEFHLTGRAELLRFLYDAGLGSKNSEGCGMIETVHHSDTIIATRGNL